MGTYLLMVLSRLKRIAGILVFVITTTIAGSLALSIAFHVENPWPWMLLASLLAAFFLYMKVCELHYLQWKDSYEVGVEEIDYDHKQLVGLINQVVTSSHKNLKENIVPKTLDELIDYTKYHLSREEALMEEYGYPEMEWHAEQHVKFFNKINRFYSKYAEKRNMNNKEVFYFLRGWLLKHISSSDKDLGVFISAKRTSHNALH